MIYPPCGQEVCKRWKTKRNFILTKTSREENPFILYVKGFPTLEEATFGFNDKIKIFLNKFPSVVDSKLEIREANLISCYGSIKSKCPLLEKYIKANRDLIKLIITVKSAQVKTIKLLRKNNLEIPVFPIYTELYLKSNKHLYLEINNNIMKFLGE